MSTITTHSRNSSSSSLSKSLPPPPSPIKHAPNPHPYAIKTTSSALTSHTTSSPSHAQAYKHYVPPPSPGSVPPSPSSRSRTSSLVDGENGRHRYSRSMKEEGPHALPMTPGMERSGSVSPRKNAEFLELDQGGSPRKSRFLQVDGDEGHFGDGTVKSMRTPRQSGAMKRRAETLPSSANAPFVFPPPPGTARLRSDSLSDADDNEHDQFSSNSYRHSHSRSHDDANSNKFASMRRSNGSRVRGMVESFERSASSSSGSELDGEGTRSRSSSPTKPNSAGSTTRRPRMVVDLFSPTSPDIGTTTLKPSSQRHSKELPRLLPYPPALAASFFSQPPAPHAPLEQMHTGAAHPLPMSPEHTGLSVASEFGMYRPQSSTARLLPIPPDLVPSPSPEAEGVLHHPRPRRGGPPELVSAQALESEEGGEEELSMEELLAREGLEGKAGKGGVKTGVNGWDVDSVSDTVKRVPTGPRPLSSNRTKTPLRTKKVSSGTRTHSTTSPKDHRGSLRDGEADREADAEGDGDGVVGSISALGFVNGRRGRRARGLKPKARSSQDSLSEGGGLKKKYGDAGSQTDESDPDSPVAAKGAAQNDVEEAKAREELEGWERELDSRTAELSSLSLEIEETQRELERTQLVLEQRSAELDSRALTLETKAGEIDERKVELERDRLELEEKKAELETAKAEIESKHTELALKSVEIADTQASFSTERLDIDARVEAVSLRETVCVERELTLDERTVLVEARERELEVRADAMRESLEESAREVEEKEKGVEEREAQMGRERGAVEEREKLVGERERRANYAEEVLGGREAKVLEKETNLVERESGLSEKETSLCIKEAELNAKESLFQTTADAFKAKQAAVNARETELDAQETTLTLATRLLKRVAGPLLGERVVGYVLRPLGMSPEAYLAQTLPPPTSDGSETSHSQAASTSSASSSSGSAALSSSTPQGGSKYRVGSQRPAFTNIWTGMKPLFRQSPYFLILGLGVCAVMLRVLIKGVQGRGGTLGVVRGLGMAGGGVVGAGRGR